GDWELSGTVLITGGTGASGTQVARWAAGAGARRVVLASPGDPHAPGATELREELASLGQATVTACDIADRDTLGAVLAAIPDLTAVVHAVGVGIDDAELRLLSAKQLDGVLRATMTSAWHLHELTQHRELDAFVLFSSGAASWGSAGQPAYAAANAFLDGLAQYRRGRWLVGHSLAWGAGGGGGG